MATSIMIDAGHGGTDRGLYIKEEEKRMTIFPLPWPVGKILKEDGINVLYTRKEDG